MARRDDRARSGVNIIQSNNQARKLVRESQTRANEKRAQRERDNAEDLGRRLEESGPLTYVTP